MQLNNWTLIEDNKVHVHVKQANSTYLVSKVHNREIDRKLILTKGLVHSFDLWTPFWLVQVVCTTPNTQHCVGHDLLRNEWMPKRAWNKLWRPTQCTSTALLHFNV